MLLTILQLAATIVPLWLVYLHFKWHSFWKVRNVPGPTPWPILGTTAYYMFRPKVEVDLEWSQKYGKVYGTFLGYEPVLKCNDSNLINYIMVKNHRQFMDRSVNMVHSKAMKSWVFMSEGDAWINKRLLITPMFTSAKMRHYAKTMTDCIIELFRQVEQEPNKKEAAKLQHNIDDGPYKINRTLTMSFALDVMCRVLHSCKINTYQGSESDFHRRIFAFGTFDVLHWMMWNILPKRVCAYYEIDMSPVSKFEPVGKLSQTLLDQRRKEIKEGRVDPSKVSDIIQMMLDAKIPDKSEQAELLYSSEDNTDSHFNNNQDHSELEKIHQDQLASTQIKFRQFSDFERCSQMTFFFIAGFDTTSSSLNFLFHALSKYQDEQDQVYQEMREAMSSKLVEEKKEAETNYSSDMSTSISNGSLSSPDDEEAGLKSLKVLDMDVVLKLKKLDQFISETLRIYPPVTQLNRTVGPKEGILFPTNPPIQLPHKCNITVDPFIAHRDPDNWPHPERFDMSRFASENKASIAPGSYMPFGIGPRNCAGLRFATLNLKQVIADIVYRYKILPEPTASDNLKLAPEIGSQYETHPFFLQLKQTSFVLEPRQSG